jgi:hypothetical protein
MYEIEELDGFLAKTGLKTLVAETMTYGNRNRLFMIAKKIGLSRDSFNAT